MVRISNWIGALLYRLREGHWCAHPPRSKRSRLINMGTGKMFWCSDCEWTWFV